MTQSNISIMVLFFILFTLFYNYQINSLVTSAICIKVNNLRPYTVRYVYINVVVTTRIPDGKQAVE